MKIEEKILKENIFNFLTFEKITKVATKLQQYPCFGGQDGLNRKKISTHNKESM